ncbi:MAG: hypothetical protein AB1650_00310 [Candidatus Omnitrophota bacterium]
MKRKILITLLLLILGLGLTYLVSMGVQAEDALGQQKIEGEIVEMDEEEGVVVIQDMHPPNDEKQLYAHPQKLESFEEGNRVRAYYQPKDSVIRDMNMF